MYCSRLHQICVRAFLKGAFHSSADLDAIRRFAQNYQPSIRRDEELDHDLPPFHLEMPNSEVAQALQNLASIESREHEKYVVLIVLRLYQTQLRMANQSYDIREMRSVNALKEGETNPIAKEFCRLLRIDCRSEFISSSQSYDYVESNPEMTEYEPIKTEMERIRVEMKRIKAGKKGNV